MMLFPLIYEKLLEKKVLKKILARSLRGIQRLPLTRSLPLKRLMQSLSLLDILFLKPFLNGLRLMLLTPLLMGLPFMILKEDLMVTLSFMKVRLKMGLVLLQARGSFLFM